MFTLTFQVCVLSLKLCAAVTPDKTFDNETACVIMANHSQDDVLESFKKGVRQWNELHPEKPYEFMDSDITMRFMCNEK